MGEPEPIGRNIYRTPAGDYHFVHNTVPSGSNLPGFLIMTPSDIPNEKQLRMLEHFQRRVYSFGPELIGQLTGGDQEPARLSNRATDLHHKLALDPKKRPYFDVAYYLDPKSADPTAIKAAIVSTKGYMGETIDVIVYGKGRPAIAVVGTVVEKKDGEAIAREVVMKDDELSFLHRELSATMGGTLRGVETLFFDYLTNGFIIVRPINPAQGLGLDQLISTS